MNVVNFLYRVILAGILAAGSVLFSGCVVSELRVGFSTTPLGPYIGVSFKDDQGRGGSFEIGGYGSVAGIPATTLPASQPINVNLDGNIVVSEE